MQLMSSSSEGSNDGDEIDPYRVPLRGTSLASPVNIVSQSQKDDNEYLSQLRAKNKGAQHFLFQTSDRSNGGNESFETNDLLNSKFGNQAWKSSNILSPAGA